jgi:hypothetical protein
VDTELVSTDTDRVSKARAGRSRRPRITCPSTERGGVFEGQPVFRIKLMRIRINLMRFSGCP